MTREAASPGFVVVHGNRLEDLRDIVVELLRADPPAPLAAEHFLVQSNGMKHWLEQSLAADHALGICAATRIELPATFLWQAYRAVLGADAVPVRLPLDKDALTWRLLRLLPELAARDASFAPLRRYLDARVAGADESEQASRRALQLAQQVADVLDGYQQYRADWLEDWERGDDVLRQSRGDPRPLPAAHAWQPRLWRALREDLGAGVPWSSRAAVHRAFESRMREWPRASPRPSGIPRRIIVFGISALPMQSVRALAEIGRVAQVLCIVQNPCRHYWGHVVEGRELLGRPSRARQRHKHGRPAEALPTDPVALHLEGHPLLASWGRQGRDYLHMLDEFDQTEARPHLLPRVDVFVTPGEASRLHRLQSGILELEPPPAAPLAIPEDGSIEFVSTHSAQREVEVLHDRVLAWLDADPTLQPRDIMVMVPDVSSFVAHIQAVFGRFPAGHARHVPYSVADASARQTPLVQALERLLRIGQLRVSLVDWLALFEVGAVRKRFGLTESEVTQLRDWLTAAGVRWGLDAGHRLRWGFPAGLGGLAQNTWAFGLRRLLLGYATGTDVAWRGVLPLPAAGGLAAQAVGRLAEWVDAMTLTLEELAQPRTPAEWVSRLAAVVSRFFEATGDEDERVIARLLGHLQHWLELCDSAGLDQPVPFAVVREHWLEQVDAPALRQRFFGGGVQFATLMPMRSIPFRIVCLLGMNDADYPRRAVPRDFDLMTEDARPGDRSRREDDRYLFLEALLSARERLYLSWQGRRATDDTSMPPSVLVGQLREELARRFAPLADPMQQPLQPFSSRYFDRDSPFRTYDADWASVQQTQAGGRPPAGPGRATGRPVPKVVTIDELGLLLRRPVEVYWRLHLGVTLEPPAQEQVEDEPFDLDALEEYGLVDDIIRRLLRDGPTSALQALGRSGRMPIGAAAPLLATRLVDKASRVVERAEPWFAAHERHPHPLEIDVVIDDLRIVGVVDDLRVAGARDGAFVRTELRGGSVQSARGRSGTARQHVLFGTWVRQVLAAAAGQRVSGMVFGIDGEVFVQAPPSALARGILSGWVGAWKRAWLRPLPLAPRTALAWLQGRPNGNVAAGREFFMARSGSRPASGEWVESPYLQRSVESYGEIAPELERWAEVLYGGLDDALRAAAAPADAVAPPMAGGRT